MGRYEFREGTSAKFWEAQVDGSTLIVRFGKVGTQGQTKEKSFASDEAARKEEAKLIKEKVGKGYVETGETALAASGAAPEAPVAETAAGPAIASATASADEETGKLFRAPALPTRTRPEPLRSPDEAWAEFRSAMLAAGREVDETPPSRMTVGKIVQWGQSIHKRLGYDPSGVADLRKSDNDKCAAYRSAAASFTEWLVGAHGPLVAAQAAEKFVDIGFNSSRAYRGAPWSNGLALALRAALTKAPEAAYDEALAWSLAAFEAQPDWWRAARFAFIFADDRPGQHALQPLAVLKQAQAQGVEVKDEPLLFPLIADAPPVEAAAWRVHHQYFFYFCYSAVTEAEACATAMAVAKANGAPAAPSLSWLLQYGVDAERTTIASAILETREEGALTALLPLLHEKWIRQALDRASAVYPGYVFRECLAVAASGRAEPAIRARLADLIARHGPEKVRAWASGLDARAVSRLEKLLGAGAELAPAEALPPMFRDPPWRRKKSKGADDVVLSIQPIAMPFDFPPARGKAPPVRGQNRELPVKDMKRLGAFLVRAETSPKYSWGRRPAPANPAPEAAMPPDEALSWLKQRLVAINREYSGHVRWSYYGELYETIERLPDPLALALWELTGPALNAGVYWDYVVPAMLRRFGEQALPGLLKLIESDPVTGLECAAQVDAPGIAPLAARALLRLKKARPLAIQWLRAHRRTAMTRLIPDAAGAPGEARDAAEHALRWFVKEDPHAAGELSALVAGYAKIEPRVAEAIEQVLNRDPLGQFPSKVAKLPAWFVPGALARPELREGGALPDDAMTALTEMLAFSTSDAIYAGVPLVREICTPQSLGVFVWDLFSAWLAAGAPSRDGWALRAVGWLGDDECARKLTALIRKWPGEAAHARAVTGLDVLADIGSDVALMNLNGVAEKVKFKGLQAKAKEKIAAIAEARDLTPEELADRLAPDLDLDERGGLDLNFGPRQFRVGFDEFLKPWVKDADNKRLKDLPKPNKSDDPELGAAAVARWSALKKDARAVASLQLVRLETMLATSRRVRSDVFWMFFASHPLIRHLAQRLVWGLYDDAAPLAKPSLIFRVSSDLAFTDSEDNPVELDAAPEAKGMIGLVHPLQIGRAENEAWGALFGDYEIMQPFPQLARETYELTEAEKAADKLDRFKGVTVESARLRGMASRGWALGDPQDGGGIWWIERPVRLASGKAVTAVFDFHDGLIVGDVEFEDKTQTLGEVELQDGGRKHTFGELDDVTASEALRGLTLLAETGKA